MEWQEELWVLITKQVLSNWITELSQHELSFHPLLAASRAQSAISCWAAGTTNTDSGSCSTAPGTQIRLIRYQQLKTFSHWTAQYFTAARSSHKNSWISAAQGSHTRNVTQRVFCLDFSKRTRSTLCIFAAGTIFHIEISLQMCCHSFHRENSTWYLVGPKLKINRSW